MAQFCRSKINNLTYKVIAAAIEVHKHLGPGLLEGAYRRCLARELADVGIPFHSDRRFDVVYKGRKIDCGFRADLYVAEFVVVELKAVQELAPIHEAQLLTYLKLSGAPVGLLINFNVTSLRHGIRRRLTKEHQLIESSSSTGPRALP